ncbi:hypothetical protein B0H19DRAFT_1061568 [Mycena capillaripes]|nr:hypothetical protein B0H19DRAFT_1061568 [Mycena capillaripes]
MGCSGTKFELTFQNAQGLPLNVLPYLIRKIAGPSGYKYKRKLVHLSLLQFQVHEPCNGVILRIIGSKLTNRATRRYSKAISRSIECDDRILIFASHTTDLTTALKENYLYNELFAFTQRMQQEVRRGRQAAESNKSDFISVNTSLGPSLTWRIHPKDVLDKRGLYCATSASNWHYPSPLKDIINNLIRSIDTLVEKTVCDWNLVGQEVTRLQDDILVHKSTLSNVQVPERWAAMAKECQKHVSELQKLQDLYPDTSLRQKTSTCTSRQSVGPSVQKGNVITIISGRLKIRESRFVREIELRTHFGAFNSFLPSAKGDAPPCRSCSRSTGEGRWNEPEW